MRPDSAAGVRLPKFMQPSTIPARAEEGNKGRGDMRRRVASRSPPAPPAVPTRYSTPGAARPARTRHDHLRGVALAVVPSPPMVNEGAPSSAERHVLTLNA